MAYQPRTYRRYTGSDDLVSYRMTLLDTDIFISSDRDLSAQAQREAARLRQDIEGYIAGHPDFKDALSPVALNNKAPFIVKEMIECAAKAGVGPMAAVAGALAEGVGRKLLKESQQVIVENGGDIFISTKRPRIIGIYAGDSKFSERVGLEIEPGQTPCGVCTSSGTVGHSLSFGKADAVVIYSRSGALADAAATSICNMVKTEADADKAIDCAKKIEGVCGVVIIIKDTMAAWGDVKLVDI